jgi:hypothetical protein
MPLTVIALGQTTVYLITTSARTYRCKFETFLVKGTLLFSLAVFQTLNLQIYKYYVRMCFIFGHFK